MSTTSSVLVGRQGKTVWVKVAGRGSFQNSPGVKEFVLKMIQRGHREFVVDLEACELMDSTFMGTLAGIALRLREMGQGNLRVTNLNERNSDLLSNLGLDQLFVMEARVGDAATAPAQVPLASAAPDKMTQAQTMLEAHEACIEANEANAAKFKDVLEYLKQDLHLAS